MRDMLGTMKGRFKRKNLKGSFYRRSLLFAILLAFVPAATVGLLLYVIGIPRIEEEFGAIHQEQVLQSVNRIDDALSNLELSASQLVFSPIFDDRLRDIDLRDQFETTQNLYRTLSVVRGSNPLITEVQVYLKHEQSIISDERGVTAAGSGNLVLLYDELMESGKSVFWTDALTNMGVKSPSSDPWSKMTLVLKLPGGGVGQVYGLMFVHLNLRKLGQLSGEKTPVANGASLLIEAQGDLISNGRSNVDEASDFELALRDKVIASPERQQSLLFTWQNETYSVSSRTFSRLGSEWIYATATPLAQLTAPVLLLSRIIMAISGLVLLAAVLISWRMSVRLYQPVHRVVGLIRSNRDQRDAAEDEPHKDEFDFIERRWHRLSRESQALQARLATQLPGLRKGFLLQLVQGHLYALSEPELIDRMDQYGWDIRERGFSTLIVHVSGALDGTAKFFEGDDRLVMFSAGNVAEEIAQTRSSEVEVIHFEDMSFGLVMLASDIADKRWDSDLRQLCDKVMHTLQSILHLDITICIGQHTGFAHKLPEVFREARQTLRYRDVNRICQILDVKDMKSRGAQNSAYPFELDKRIIQSIRMGEEEEAADLVARFVDELQARSTEEFPLRQALLQLLGNIQFAILQSGYHLQEIYGETFIFEQFNQQHKPEQMVRWFTKQVIQPYTSTLKNTTDLQNKQLIEKAIRIIELHYMKDISLEWCAEQLGTYPQKVSIVFKQVTGLNFIDYLTRHRLEKSMKLLADTDIKINDIAESVGYQPSYFNRLFKKRFHMTPGQYREESR